MNYLTISKQWRHNERDGVLNHQRPDCLLQRLFRRRSKKTSKHRVTGLCEGNSPVTGEFPAQRASNAENVSIWWRLHVQTRKMHLSKLRFPALRVVITINVYHKITFLKVVIYHFYVVSWQLFTNIVRGCSIVIATIARLSQVNDITSKYIVKRTYSKPQPNLTQHGPYVRLLRHTSCMPIYIQNMDAPNRIIWMKNNEKVMKK